MQFYRHADGSVTVDSFDDEITVSYELLHVADRKFLQVEPDWSQLTILGARYQLFCADNITEQATFRRV